MPRRTRPDRAEPAQRVLWSASEHLVVEAPITAHDRHRRARSLAAVALLAVCAAALGYLLTNLPTPRLSTLAARSPAAWVQRYAHILHRQLRLETLVEYGGDTVAVLQRSDDVNSRMLITLHREGRLWRWVEH